MGAVGGVTPNRGWGTIVKKLLLCALLLVGTLMRFMNGRGLGYGDVHGIEAIYP